MSFHATLSISPAGDSLQDLADANEAGLRAVISHWHDRIMPGHFTPAGARKYKYQPRKGELQGPTITTRKGRTVNNPGYYWRKVREGKGRNPLVYSGRSMVEASQPPKVRIKRQKSDGKIVATANLNVPKYFYQYRKDHKAPDKAAELTVTTPDEQQLLLNVHNAAADAHLRSIPRPTQRQTLA